MPALTSLHQLPPARELFGREADLSELEQYLETRLAAAARGGTDSTVVGFQGMGGVGKSALAIALAHRVKEHFPDAQLVLNLRGVDPVPARPEAIMQRVIQSFHPEAPIPEEAEQLVATYRSELARAGRVLLLLDNAAGAEQVLPLLPPPNCLLIVTSRVRFQLPGLLCRAVGTLDPDASCRLLLRLAPRLADHACVAAELCGHLPLALEVFANVVGDRTTYSPLELIERMRRGAGVFDRVDAAFALSYELLPPALQRRWTQLSVFLGSFDAAAAAAVSGEVANEQAVDVTREELQELVTASLVEWHEQLRRYRLHDLARRFGSGKLSGEDAAAAQLRHARHYCGVAKRSSDLYYQGGAQVVEGLRLFDRERRHFESAFAWLVARTDLDSVKLLVRLVDGAAYAAAIRFHPREKIPWHEAQLKAARAIGDRGAEADALGNLGIAHRNLGDTIQARKLSEQQLALALTMGDRRREAGALGNLGGIHFFVGEMKQALAVFEQRLAISRELGDRRGESNALGNLGSVWAELGQHAKAIEFYAEQLSIIRLTGDRRAEATALGSIGIASKNLGDPPRAIRIYEQQLAIAREIGDRGQEGNALGSIGVAYHKLKNSTQARTYHEQHLTIAREIGDRRGEASALGGLGLANAAMGKLAAALEFYEQQLKIVRQTSDSRGEANALFNSALACQALGNRAQALTNARSALKIYERTESPHANRVRSQIAQWTTAAASPPAS